MPATDYFITKLSFRPEAKRIQNVFVYKFDNGKISPIGEQQRSWMVDKIGNGSSISILTPNPSGDDQWDIGNKFTYINDVFTWGKRLPQNITRRKTFISYYHKDDQLYKEKFLNLFHDLIVSKSVEKGDIKSENSDDYIRELIQKDYLADTTVLVVLIGAKTKCRKHVDWEISGAISTKVGGNSGLVGILLPSHPDFGLNKKCDPDNIPQRLAANINSGYAKLYDWTEDRVKMQQWIEEAFIGRSDINKRINTSILQMDRDICE